MMASFAIHQLNVSCVTPLHNIINAIISPKHLYTPRGQGSCSHQVPTAY